MLVDSMFRPVRFLLLTGAMIALCIAGGCNSDEVPESDATAETTKTSVQSEPELEPLEVPDGSPDELFNFMDETTDRELGENQDEEQEEYGRRLIRLMKSRIVACDKIFKGDPPDEAKTRALRIRLDAMRTLAALRPEEYTQDFESYAAELANSSDEFVQRMAKSIQFQAAVNRYISQANQKPDEVLASLTKLLAEPDAGPEIFNAVRDATGWVFQSGDIETATTMYRTIGDHFANHSDEILAAEATNIQSQAIELSLKQLIFQITKGETQPQELVDRVKQMIAPQELDEPILAYAMQTASFFENDGHYAEAEQTYDLVYERFSNDQDADTAEAVKRSIEYARKRLGLLGSKLSLDGVRLSGRPFDWNDYRGKWTIVCFWTSWHTEWKAEASSIRKAIAAQGDKEIEVVSINMDDDRNALERFLQESPSRWPVVVSPDPATPGFENSNAVRCGVEAVPFVLLVDPEGKVTDIHLLGDRLPAALEKRIK